MLADACGTTWARWRPCWRLGLVCIVLIALVALWRRTVDGAGRDRRRDRRSAGRFTARCTGWASRRCRPRGSGRSSTCGPARSTTSATALIADLDAHAADSRPGGRPAGDRAPGLAAPDGLPGVAGPPGLADRAGLEPRRPAGDRRRRCATPRCSFACSTKTSACSGPSGSTASANTTGSGSTSTSSGTSRPTRGGSVTSGPLNPSTGLLYGAALAIALGLLGYNVVVNEQISIATMLILLVSLAGLAYPIAEWLRHAEGDPPGQSLGPRHLRVPRTAARAPPERRRPLPERPQGPDHASRTSRSRAARAAGCSRASRSRSPPARAPRSWARTRTPKLALACLIPRLIDPTVRPRPDRRPRPPRRDARLGPRPGRHRAPGRPGLHRLGPGEHRPGRPDEHPAPDHRGRQGGPRPPLHPGPAARLRHDRSARSAITSSPTSSSGSPWPAPTCTIPRS